MSKVDVLIPAFNAAHFLPGAIESVLAQTEADWHIVIVDDGSTDNTREVVSAYVDRLGDQLTYLYQENRGLPAARNAGIRVSSAPLIALLDADDLWLPNRLADTLPLFESDPQTGLTYGGVVRFREAGEVLDTFRGNRRNGQGLVAREIFTRQIELPCPTVTFRRSCLDRVGYFDETLRATEDRDLWLRIAQQFHIGFVPKVLARYRVSENSMSADLTRMLSAQQQFIRKHSGEEGCGWVATRVALSRVRKQQAEGYLERSQLALAVRHAIHAAMLAPWEGDNIRTAASVVVRMLMSRFRRDTEVTQSK